jgi:PAS domain S-box-containing protein
MKIISGRVDKAHATRFTLISIIFVAVQIAILALGWGALRLVDTTRAYATGESLYSKASSAAVIDLYRFADTRYDFYWKSFLSSMDIVLGDRQARQELLRDKPDYDLATTGFLRGGNDIRDIPDAILVFRWFQNWGPFESAIQDWQRGDQLIDRLRALGTELHASLREPPLSQSDHDRVMHEIDATSRQLTALERNFAVHIANAARAAKTLVTVVLCCISLALWIFGVGLSWRAFRRGIIAEADLRQSEKRFRDFAVVASDWFWETDAELRITYLSDRFASATGITPQELQDETNARGGWWHVTRPSAECVTRVTERRGFRGHIHRHVDANGESQYWKISGIPVFDAAGVFQGYRGTGTNVTVEVRAAEALRQAKEASDDANRAKSEFLANISHELRTPLNAILGFSAIAKDQLLGHAPEKYAEYAADIFNSGNLLLALINDILDLSKIEAGRMVLDEELVDINEIIEASIRLIQQNADAARLNLFTDLADNLPLLHADQRKLTQLILNLLSNSVKFTPREGSISVAASRDLRGNLIVLIRDTGIGIPPDKIATVLEPFGQIQNSMTRAHAGTGLGLPLAKALTELHGGTLTLKSELGRGTDVVITLPRERLLETPSLQRDEMQTLAL